MLESGQKRRILGMGKNTYQPEQIIAKLREAEVRLSKGQTVVEIVRQMGITEQTYYRWRKVYGGMQVNQALRLKALEKENSQLKKTGSGSVAGQRHPQGGGQGKLLSPAKRRRAVEHVRTVLHVPQRRACRVLGQAQINTAA